MNRLVSHVRVLVLVRHCALAFDGVQLLMTNSLNLIAFDKSLDASTMMVIARPLPVTKVLCALLFS